MAGEAMSNAAITALATGLLVVVGIAQVGTLVAQHRQHRLDLAEAYRRRWADCRRAWAAMVFVGRDPGGFYQVADQQLVKELSQLVGRVNAERPSTWALEAASSATQAMGDVCLRILTGQLSVSDAYPLFGTEFLRQTRPLRRLLDAPGVEPTDDDEQPERPDNPHYDVQAELQSWLVYHDGLRRRCLILVDLLWAEAARLEDLPAEDLIVAANAKRETGHLNRQRVRQECLRIRGPLGLVRARRLSHFLRHAEHRRRFRRIGLKQARLHQLRTQWLERLLSIFDDRMGSDDLD